MCIFEKAQNNPCDAEEIKRYKASHKNALTNATRGNIQPKLKQYLLGHASMAVTQNIYTDTTAEYLESVSERVQNVFCGI